MLDAAHGGEVVILHGLVVGAGVDHGGVELLVPQELLDGGHRATGVEQLGGGGMPQAVRIDLHPHPLPGILDATVHQVFAQRLVAVEEDVVGWTQARAPPGMQ